MKLALTLLLCAGLASGQSHIIRAGTVLDGRGNVALNQTIVIADDRITSIGDSAAVPDIDLSGLTLMPGWIGACMAVSDADSIFESQGKAYGLLKSGFTTVIAPSTRLRDLIDDRRWAGPRIMSRGSCSEAAKFFDSARDHKPLTAEVFAGITSGAAERLGISDSTGTVAPGMLADLVATGSNPMVDGGALRDVVFVMKEGRVYKELPQPERRKLILRQ